MSDGTDRIVYADGITAGYTIYGKYPAGCGYEDELEIWWWPVESEGGAMSSDDTQKTKVAHCKADEIDVYAGRGPDGSHMLNSLVDERGWLGNPFTLDEHERDENIEKFRTEFVKKLERDPTFAAAIADLSGKTLGCWCQRRDDDSPACHAEIIAEHADRLNRNKTDFDRGENHE